MKISKIAVFDPAPAHPLRDNHMRVLQTALPESEILFVSSVADLSSKTDDVDVVVTMPGELDAMYKFCKAAPSFKWMHLLLSGTDMMGDTPFAAMPGLTITSTRGIHAPPMSDHALAFIFAFLRGIPGAVENKRNRCWASRDDQNHLNESAFMTVGIIGAGSIGTGVAEKCKKLGMTTLGLRRNPVASEWYDEVYTADRLDELLPKCDFVVITAPLTEETRGMIGSRQFDLMKSTAVVINLGRGPIIDQPALIEALKSGGIGGAGLDVTDPEPLPGDSELWDCPNTIITSHISAHSPYYMDRAIEVVAENCRRFLAGEELLYTYKKG